MSEHTCNDPYKLCVACNERIKHLEAELAKAKKLRAEEIAHCQSMATALEKQEAENSALRAEQRDYHHALKRTEADLAAARHDYETADKNWLDMKAERDSALLALGQAREALKRISSWITEPHTVAQEMKNISRAALTSSPNKLWEAWVGMREALQWYSDDKNWDQETGVARELIRQPNTVDGPGETVEEADMGYRAEKALALADEAVGS